MNKNRQKTITAVLCILYILFLTWVILFKMQTNFSIFHMKYRNINLIPFQGSVIVNGKIELSEIILNIIAFIPYGIYISILKEDWNFLKKTALIFCTSFFYETAQYILGIGASDITDLLGNTLGGAAGIMLFWILSKILKDNTIKAVNILAGIGTAFILALVFILIAANV